MAVAVIGVVLLGMFDASGADAAPYRPSGAQKEPVVSGRSQVPQPIPPQQTGTPFAPAAVNWPAQAINRAASQAADQRAKQSVKLAPGSEAASVRVDSLGRSAALAAGIDGVLLRVSRSDGVAAAGKARLSVDYQGYRWAFGGDWAYRLKVWALPECALFTPEAAGCRARELASTNDTAKGTLTADVSVSALQPTKAEPMQGSTLLAVAAAAGGSGGDYKATSLSPSATWNAGGNSGDFSWSYALRMPPAINGPAPAVSFDYSSSSVDGRMASANNQASAIGEGFDYNPGYIERRYNACAEDMGSGANNTEKTGDLCWETDNATLSMSGHAGELIRDASNVNLWHLRGEDGTRIERKTGGPNGAKDGEWWVVTTTDGTQYRFGGRSGSNAVLTVPVFGNHSGEPCHASLFKDSSCVQGYRWQLDHVVDLNGNTMSLTYHKETNKYGRNNIPTDDTVYDRDGYVDFIEYGTRTGDPGSAPMRVDFAYGDRCFTTCSVNANWADVPLDQECTADTCAWTQLSPTFWTKRRLTSVKTQVWGGLSYRDVELWTLTHSFPSSDQPTLWLDKVAHSGLVGGATTVPDVTFVGVAMPNRVDTNSDQYPAMNRYRMKTITSETGGKIDLTYTGPDCVAGTRVPDKDNLHLNTLRCYPVKWQPEGAPAPITDFFHKYLISDVVEADLSGSSSRVLNHYDYVGAPAWHYTDDDGFIKAENKTWSVWRGYAAVQTTKGDPGEQTRDERRYFRGMHGDKLPSGTRNVVLPAINPGGIPAVNDEDAYAGRVRETVIFDGPGGAEVSATIIEPWMSAPTASRTFNGHTVYARYVETTANHTRTILDGGRAPRTTSEFITFDSYGLKTKVDERGDDAVTGDESCTLIEYARNTAINLVQLVSRERGFAVDCARAQGAAQELTEAQVLGEERSSYDELGWNATPTKGNVTKGETMKAYNNGNPTFITENTSTYDAHGRPLDVWDVRGGKTSHVYTPAVGGPLTSTKEISPLGWEKTTVNEPAWGLPLSTVDPNLRKAELTYDGMGRLTAVWMPGRDKASQSASLLYEYNVRNNAPTVVTTKKLNAAGGYLTSYMLHDNMLRLRQTQEADAAGGTGTVVSDTFYDSTGRTFKTFDPYVAPVAPGESLFIPTGNIPSLTVFKFDGANRQIAQIYRKDGPPASDGGTEKWRTTNRYGGDRVDVTPPLGGTPTSVVTDAKGNTVEFRQYRPGFGAGGSTGYDKTSYEYNAKDKVTKITDPAGNVWRYGYDVRGRHIRTEDPDRGVAEMTYTDAGDVETIKDARNSTIAYTYDLVGRKTSLRSGSTTGPTLAGWFYDTLSNGVQAKGQLVKTVRYKGADQYVQEEMGYTIDYKPTSVRYTIPPAEVGLAGTYTYVYSYNQDGSLATTRLPAVGDLGLETLTTGYNALGRPSTMDTSLGGTLVAKPDANTPGTEYTSFGEVGAIHLRNNAGPRADVARRYETDTRRLSQIWTTKATGVNNVADVRYNYDNAGNVNKISDLTSGDTQCFGTDHLQRMTEAWTPSNGDCSMAPSATALGGPAPYWHSYRHDAVGNRTKLIQHTAAGDATTDYTTVGHRLTSTTGPNSSYGYDPAGNLTSRPSPAGGAQALTWDAEGHLATTQDSTGTTSYLYDVEGNRLISETPTGKTLFLPGQELRYSKSSGVKAGVRFYSHNSEQIAVRSSAGLNWITADKHGTAQVSVQSVGQAVAIRRDTPFGQSRAGTGSWPSVMDRGFVGGTMDSTGLTHLGAREYDPAVGLFVSRDPVMMIGVPQQINGYSYGNNNPETFSDPEGLCWPSWVCEKAKQVANGISNAWNTGTRWVSTAWNNTTRWIDDRWEDVKRFGKSVWKATVNVAKAAWKVTAKVAKAVWRGVTKVAKATWKAITNVANKVWNAVKWVGSHIDDIARRGWQIVRAKVNAPLSLAVLGLAEAGGADCGLNMQELMFVCQNAPTWMYERRGTTIGNVYLTGSNKPSVREMAHEAKHADQWALFQMAFGPKGILIFAGSYLGFELGGMGGAKNPYERWAGLDDGCYTKTC